MLEEFPASDEAAAPADYVDYEPPPLPPRPSSAALALLDEADVDRCSREELQSMLRELLADRVRLLQRHSQTVEHLSGRLRLRVDEMRSLRQAAEAVGRENTDLRRLLSGVDSERLRLVDLTRQWQALASQSGAALSGDLPGLQAKVAALERLLHAGSGGGGRRLPADGQEASPNGVVGSASVVGVDDTERRLAAVEARLEAMESPPEALMLRHLVTLARQKAAATVVRAAPPASPAPS